MARPILTALDRDLDRLLFAGARAARTDADLRAHGERLGRLVAGAPALAAIAAQIDRVQRATAGEAAAPLLDLAARMAQVRGALAAPAEAAGELAPLPPSLPVESPLSPADLALLLGALTRDPPVAHRAQTIRDAVARGAVRDLRVLPFCVAALADPEVSVVVEHDLLPALGALVVPELLSTLRIAKGREIDGRKLRVIAEIEGAAAEPLLLAAIDEGSAELRKAAIKKLFERNPERAEPIALRMLASDRSAEVKRAAVTALADGRSDEALAALFAAFLGRDELGRYAGISLARLDHPRVTERALAELTPARCALPELVLPRPRTPAKKKENALLEKAHREEVELLCAVLDLLASRPDRRETAPRTLAIFRTHPIREVRNAAARALLKSGYEESFDELCPAALDADWQTRDELIEGILEQDPPRAFDRLGRFLDPASIDGAARIAFAEHLLGALEKRAADTDDPEPRPAEASLLALDPRWVEAAIGLLDHAELARPALEVLAGVRSERAREAAIARAGGKLGEDEAFRLFQVLKGHRDPRVPAILVRMLAHMSNHWGRRAILEALREHDDPAVAPSLRAFSAQKKLDRRDRDELDALLASLERDRSPADPA
ncbi:MAG: HEAT repeat domain-containing protein [Byssovorax sp.]